MQQKCEKTIGDDDIMRQHVLVVDDDEAIRESIRILLEDEYDVSIAKDGVQAIEFLEKSERPSIVLLDYGMPRLDGVGVLKKALADPVMSSRNAFIMVTAYRENNQPEMVQFCHDHAIPLVPKPFEIDQIVAHVLEAATHLPSDSAAL